MNKPEARRRNRRGEGAQLRADIVAAGRELIEDAGTATAVTLRAVARRVGIAAPSIYAHFADPEQIIRAVVVQAYEEFLRDLQSARAGIEDPRARLIAGCEAYLKFGAESFRLLVDDVAATAAAGASRTDDPFRTTTAL